ncbi:MAG: flagellar biosynthesis anti-sigma factor FlgM [Caldimicrobium sp.]|nr:flagellar biosynthesis anti-sigma factor FlgM [Caldimicrobium sp.]MCX7873159.1 flagellar biosynthesis anti-sigma factor FlgM [Caldimicrobium sp.]MDW8094263.1 flagellar biosynthesis anti-sigma factor FlgM [Caldimicrobium sp.]
MKITDLVTSKTQFFKDKEILRDKPEEIKSQRDERVAKSEDQIQISLNATIQRAKLESSNYPEIREERVAQLRERIQSGSYEVSNRDLARAMIATLFSEIA